MEKQHIPDIKKAVTELIYMIESEESKVSTKQNRETVIACRNALSALIGTRQVPKAKAWLEAQRG